MHLTPSPVAFADPSVRNSAFSPFSTATDRTRLAETAGTLILRAAGEDLLREGVVKTPARFAKALDRLVSGYQGSVEETVGGGVFEAEGPGLVSVQNIEFYSLCEHHMLPFWGTASVAYYPGKHIIGLSKIPRLLDLFSRRFQVQERLTRQLAESLVGVLQPRAVAVQIKASHLCVMMRGVEKQGSQTQTEFSHGLENLNTGEQERLWNSL